MRLPGLIVLFLLVTACSKDEAKPTPAPSATATSEERPHLPAPFRAVQLGATREKLAEQFPETGDLSECSVQLVGAARSDPAGSGRRMRCATIDDVAGLTASEKEALLEAAKAAEPLEKERQALVIEALVLTVAQLRGALRSGHLEQEVLDGATDEGKSPSERVIQAATRLVEGTTAFARMQSSRRVMGAVFAEDCSGVVPEQVRAYVAGEVKMDELDERARERVAQGPCKDGFLRHEKLVRRQFLALTGGLGGVGLARALLDEEQTLDPDDQSSFTVFSTRSRLGAPMAELGVRLAIALPKVESTFSKAVVLSSGDAEAPFRDAVAWFGGGKLARVLLNLPVTEGFERAKRGFDAMYGEASTEGTGVKWTLPSGAGTARLDFGATMALTLVAGG